VAAPYGNARRPIHQPVSAEVDAGGMGVGVGEWRPEKKGMNGTYHVDTDREITVLAGGR
jgi:hypothetical protein